jgi:hypothetical protein
MLLLLFIYLIVRLLRKWQKLQEQPSPVHGKLNMHPCTSNQSRIVDLTEVKPTPYRPSSLTLKRLTVPLWPYFLVFEAVGRT